MVELLQTSSNKWFSNNQHETHETTGAEQIAQSLPSQPSTATTFSNDLPSSEGLVASKGNLPRKSNQLWIKHPRLHGSTAQEFTDLLSTPFGASKNYCPVPIPMSHIHSGLREGAFDATCVLLRSCEGYTQFVCPMGVAAAGATGALPYLEVATHPP